MAVKKYWKISRVVMVITRKNIEFITSDTITTSNIFQYFLTAMPDSHSLILNMIQQFEKKILNNFLPGMDD